MNTYEQESSNPSPTSRVCNDEFKDLFIKFCALMCIINHKKLNLANIFLYLLKEKKAMELYKTMCDFDHEFEALKCFLDYDGSLHKSKYIKKYLNAQNGVTAKKSKKRSAKKK